MGKSLKQLQAEVEKAQVQTELSRQRLIEGRRLAAEFNLSAKQLIALLTD